MRLFEANDVFCHNCLPSVSINRPAGWDNLNKISILYENLHSCGADNKYEDVIASPPQRKVNITEHLRRQYVIWFC